jgi:hypothetical protein
MKTVLKTASTAARRLFWLYQVRSLELTIDGQTTTLEYITDRMLETRIIAARHITRRELAAARANYNALLPVGQRRTWRMA